MLQPKKTKYKKQQKGRIKRIASRGTKLAFGDFGIKSLEAAYVTNFQIEAARIVISKSMKREGKVWIKIFPDKPMTKKPAEVRMGKGKGALDHWTAVVSPGRILFEISGVSAEIAKETLRLAAQKLPVKTRFIVADDFLLNN